MRPPGDDPRFREAVLGLGSGILGHCTLSPARAQSEWDGRKGKVGVTTELVLLGTAGAPMPVAGRAGISSALIVDGRVFVIDRGRGSPSAFADAGLDFAGLEAVFLTHLHADHTGDLAGLLIYPWGGRSGDDGPLPPIRVYGPSRPGAVPVGDASFRRQTTIHPELPAPGTEDLVRNAEWVARAGQGLSGTTTAGRDGLRRALPRVTS